LEEQDKGIVPMYANTRLIAKAPELLEALEEARREMFGDPDYDGPVVITTDRADIRDRMDKIIAEAKGENL
jgi:hypothetical protein